MRAKGHAEVDLPPLPSPSEAPYTEQEIDFEAPAYIESLIRAQAGGAGRSEEGPPPADDSSVRSSSEEEGGDSECTAMDKAIDVSIAVLDHKVWDHVRQEEALLATAGGVNKLGRALVAALNTPGKAGRQSYARICKDIKLQMDELNEAMTRAEAKAQVLYELEVMNLVEESENLKARS